MNKTNSIKRRDFIAQGSSIAAIGFCGIAGANEKAAENSAKETQALAKSIGKRFLLVDESGQRCYAELIEVAVSKYRPGPGFRRAVSILFRPTNRHQSIKQAVYRIQGDSIAPKSMLLVPISPPGSPPVMEAVIC